MQAESHSFRFQNASHGEIYYTTPIAVGISFAKVGISEELEEHGYVNNPAIIFLLIDNKLRHLVKLF